MPLFAAVALVVGLGLVIVAVLVRARDRDAELRRLLDVDVTGDDLDEDQVREATDRLGLLRPAANAAGVLLERVDRDRKLATRLERAHVVLRPGEFLLAVVGIGVVVGGWLWAVSGLWLLGVVPVVGAPLIGSVWLDSRISRRKRALEEQLPNLLTGIAASVRGGHPLLRATELIADEAPSPLGEELDRVLAETRLGVPIVDAFERFAERSGLEDLGWVVEAIRIQQSVGGKLSDLLFTLSEHLREREEIRREVKTLTAEGRMSTWLLGGLPIAMAVYLSVTSPDYIRPMFSGLGLLLLGVAAVLVVVGVVLIVRMVRKVVL
ncbi:hypothetical protein FTX61_06350 [Nitriliruptoraceae bacterium ZYF776]|nr:hypothetical protein [Profundirhabdus halotolerans]